MPEHEWIIARCSWCGRMIEITTRSAVEQNGPLFCSELCEYDAEASQPEEREYPEGLPALYQKTVAVVGEENDR